MCPFERMKDRSSIVRVECFKSTNTIKTPGHTPRDTHPPHLLHQGGPQVKPPLVALIARRRELAARYREELAEKVPSLGLPFEPAWARSNYQSFCVRLPQNIEQIPAMRRLAALGVQTRRGVMCAHREPAYPAGTWRGPGDLAESEAAHARTLLSPRFSSMTEAEQDRVIDALAAVCRS